ncbi:unnamed protein product [Allacma fusca]|uniref:Uncharacterized protein n=1 Tax=Allacma fusca TaxID=39272 RepID=A0A8J2JQG3_9HEXA|nr:unnamed protein product [Allacma fusca]
MEEMKYPIMCLGIGPDSYSSPIVQCKPLLLIAAVHFGDGNCFHSPTQPVTPTPTVPAVETTHLINTHFSSLANLAPVFVLR